MQCEDKLCLNCSGAAGACTVNPTGKSCSDKAYWNGTKCVDCEEGCLKCDSNGICLRCDAFKGIGMGNDGKCIFKILEIFFTLGILAIIF